MQDALESVTMVFTIYCPYRISRTKVNMTPDLIYDVGMYNGDDTDYYLAKGFRVVAIEANPVMAELARTRFAAQIAAQRLTILDVAVAPTAGPHDFWINDRRSNFSSFDERLARRGGARCRRVTVQGVPFHDILREYGVPFYLKVDIESADIHCLRAIDSDDRPHYLSVEANSLEYLALLHHLGYNAFKCIDQSRVGCKALTFNNEHILGELNSLLRYGLLRVGNAVDKALPSIEFRSARRNSSGPFGEDTPGEWEPFDRVAYNWLHYRFGKRRRGTLNMWARGYDFHATTLPVVDTASISSG